MKNNNSQANEVEQSTEVITRYEKGSETKYSFDGGETWWTRSEWDELGAVGDTPTHTKAQISTRSKHEMH